MRSTATCPFDTLTWPTSPAAQAATVVMTTHAAQALAPHAATILRVADGKVAPV
jgi:energy-coupling factor transporter ATP-binding protein EcfA2